MLPASILQKFQDLQKHPSLQKLPDVQQKLPDLQNLQNEQTLVGMRLAIGGGAWLAPRFTGRLFGLSPKANPQSPYLARLFASRDLALAVGLHQSEGEARKLWIQLGIVCDAADAVAGLMAGGKRYLNPFATLMVTGTAVGAVAIGVGLLNDAQPEG